MPSPSPTFPRPSLRRSSAAAAATPLLLYCALGAAGTACAAFAFVTGSVAGGGALFAAGAAGPVGGAAGNGFETPADEVLSPEEIAEAAKTGSDRALAEYWTALHLLRTGEDDRAAFALIDAAAARSGLSVESAAAAYPAPRNTSPSIVLLRLIDALCSRAEERAGGGDGHGAAEYLARARTVAAQVLAADDPTLDTLHALRSLDTRTLRAEAEVLRRSGRVAEADTALSRLARLRDFCKREVQPAVAAARDRREEAIRGSPARRSGVTARAVRTETVPAEATAATSPADRELAARLLRAYAAERVRLAG